MGRKTVASPVEAETLPSRLKEAVVRQGVAALVQHIKGEEGKAAKANLLEDDGHPVQIQLTLRKTPEHISMNPKKLKMPHSMRSNATGGCDMCLFVKDKDKDAIEEVLHTTPVEGLTTILTLTQLRTEYKAFKDRRELRSEHDLFLCDDSIIPMMSKTLGKTFISANRRPVKVNTKKLKSLPQQIAAARDGTSLTMARGNCWAVRVGNSAMSVDSITQNILSAVPQAVDRVPNKWKNIQGVHLQAHQSVALPLYTAVVENIRQKTEGEEAHEELVKQQQRDAREKKAAAALEEGISASNPGKGKKRKMKNDDVREQLKELAKRRKGTKGGVVRAGEAESSTPKKSTTKSVTTAASKKVAKTPAKEGSKGVKSGVKKAQTPLAAAAKAKVGGGVSAAKSAVKKGGLVSGKKGVKSATKKVEEEEDGEGEGATISKQPTPKKSAKITPAKKTPGGGGKTPKKTRTGSK